MKKPSKAFFPGIPGIQYEGPRSKNPLAFKHYNPDELVAGKPMKDHLRFSVTYWHTIRGQLADMFGAGTAVRPWEDGTNSMKMAEDARAGGLRVPGKAGGAVLRLPRPRRGARRANRCARPAGTWTPL